MTTTLPGLDYQARHNAKSPDPAATLVGVTLLVMFVVPGRFAFGPSGVRLSTTSVLGLLALLTWLSYFLFKRKAVFRINPVAVFLLVYGVGVLFSASSAYARPLTDLEAGGVLRSVVLSAASVGLALLLSEGARSAAGLHRLVTLALLGGYFSAIIGLAQKVFSFGYIELWRNVPGLYTSAPDVSTTVLLSNRAIGTASHPIEFSVACACLVPLALVHARMSNSRNATIAYRLGAGLLVAGTLIGVSRSGFIGIVIVAIFCVPRLPFKPRMNLLAGALVVLIFVQFALPGTLSTLRYQLLNIGDDASSKGRTQDYGPVFDLVHQHPWRGIGAGTFLPQQYLFLDNAWLGTLVSGGTIGVVLLGSVLLGTLFVGGMVKRQTLPGSYLHEITHAACVMLLVLAVCAYFFDEFSFTQTATLFFVSIGLIGAGWSVAQDPIAEDRTAKDGYL